MKFPFHDNILQKIRKTWFLFLLIIIFLLLHFSKMPERIFMKISGIVYIGLERLKIIFGVMTSLPVRDIDDFPIFRVSFCSEIFSKTTQDIFFKFLRIICKWLNFVPFEFQVSSFFFFDVVQKKGMAPLIRDLKGLEVKIRYL